MERSSFTADSLLMERFPQLGLLSASWSYSEAVEEPLPQLELDRVEALYFYGLGTGALYFEVKKWLKENPERELIFLEDNPGILASFLHRPHAVEILSDPQVYFELLSKNRWLDQELTALIERRPLKRIEVAALPSYKGKRFQNLRLKILRKTTLSHALHLDRLHGYQPFLNFVENLPLLSQSFYANGLKGAFQNIPAIVCGAGPSLQRSIETLRQLENKALLIAGGSTLAALSSQGISPHFGMAIDPNLEEYRRLKNSFAFECPILYSTRVFPAIFQTSNGPFGYMRSGIGGASELWIEEELGLLDPLLGDFLSPESISVTAICVAWAQFLGCNPIFLNGVDLAYTGNKRYAAGVTEEEEVFFAEIEKEKSAADRILKRKDQKGNAIYTAVRWVMESSSISHFAKNHPEVRFINTTEGGIGFKGIQEIPLAEAACLYLTQELDLRGLVNQKIQEASMPSESASRIEEKKRELKESLGRLIHHLKILAGESKGSLLLAEMELKEEIAYSVLFYDMDLVLDQALSRSFPSWLPEETLLQKQTRMEQFKREKAKKFLELAIKYEMTLRGCSKSYF